MVIANVIYEADSCSIHVDCNTNISGQVFDSAFNIPISSVFQSDLLPESVRQKHIKVSPHHKSPDSTHKHDEFTPSTSLRFTQQTNTPIKHSKSERVLNHKNENSTYTQPNFFFPPNDDSNNTSSSIRLKKQLNANANANLKIHKYPETCLPETNPNSTRHDYDGDDDNVGEDSSNDSEDSSVSHPVFTDDVLNSNNDDDTYGLDHHNNEINNEILKPRIVVSVPIISIIMTTYNCGKYIEFAVRSLQMQTLTNWELIIINDKSTDHSDSIIRTLAQNDDRIVYLHNIHNIGCYASKNIALRYARGTWLTFHDADDHSMSERLEKQLHFCIHGEQNETNTKTNIESHTFVYECCYVTSLSRKEKVWSWVPITMFIHSTIFREKLGVFDTTRFGADSEIRNRMDILGIRVGVIDDYLYTCPDRWIEINFRKESLTGNRNHDPIRIKYKNTFMRYHNYVKQTNILQHLYYTIPSPNGLRPFSINGLSKDEMNLLYPSYTDIQKCLQFNDQCES